MNIQTNSQRIDKMNTTKNKTPESVKKTDTNKTLSIGPQGDVMQKDSKGEKKLIGFVSLEPEESISVDEFVKPSDTSKPFVEKCRDLTNDKYDHSTAALMEKYNREMLALLNKEIGR